MNDSELLDDLLLQWEDQFDLGYDVPAEVLARDCPHLTSRLAEAIQKLKVIDWLRRPVVDNPGRDTPPAHQSGDILGGRYRLDKEIGEGGHGVVWRGFDLDLQRTVAIKVPWPGRAAPLGGDRLLAEARLLRQLRHSGIVPIYAAGRDGPTVFVVSKFIDGGTLADRIRFGSLSVEYAELLVRKVADVLDHVHAQDIVHLDVKPANILIDRRGPVYLADFGIAATADEAAAPRRPVGGTLSYMAPEQLRGEGPFDRRCDIYSLGVVFYELLTGQLPFGTGALTDLHAACRNELPPPPSALNPRVLRHQDRACLGCLEPSPQRRLASIEAFKAGLLLRAFRNKSRNYLWLKAIPPLKDRNQFLNPEKGTLNADGRRLRRLVASADPRHREQLADLYLRMGYSPYSISCVFREGTNRENQGS